MRNNAVILTGNLLKESDAKTAHGLISITAALHAAFACNNTKFIDLDGSFDLSGDVVAGGFVLRDGIMSLSEKSGLGLTRL